MFNALTMKRLVAISTILGALIVAALASADHPIELGQTTTPPAVSCPANCQAVGQVTGFEVQQGTSKNPFQRKRRGKVVAFSITLGKPKTSDVNFFNKLFGTPPQAQLVVLKPGTKQRYSTGDPALLSGVLQGATGKTVLLPSAGSAEK